MVLRIRHRLLGHGRQCAENSSLSRSLGHPAKVMVGVPDISGVAAPAAADRTGIARAINTSHARCARQAFRAAQVRISMTIPIRTEQAVVGTTRALCLYKIRPSCSACHGARCNLDSPWFFRPPSNPMEAKEPPRFHEPDHNLTTASICAAIASELTTRNRPFPAGFCNGRYWARTSDPQLVEHEQEPNAHGSKRKSSFPTPTGRMRTEADGVRG
jgi:hypothetical protein